LLIELPPQIRINGACRVESVEITGEKHATKMPKCIATTAHKMKILKFLHKDYTAGASNTISIKIGDLINASSTGKIEGMRVSILVHNEYLID
jgi:hypothetical protein